MWSFIPYEKIVESPDSWQLDERGYRQLRKVSWVVTEKIHGANFCFITDGQVVRHANRKRFLSPDEDFFHYQRVAADLQPQILQSFSLLKQRHPSLQLLFVYGELFGGGYPHPEVAANPSVQLIQTGIYYTPDIAFCAFDAALLLGKERTYLDYDQAIDIWQQVGLFHAKPLFTGTFEDALTYPLGFDSTIPQQLGLPPLSSANKAEGIVIKPLKHLLVPSSKGEIRPVFKKKIPEFAEDKRFGLAEKWSEPHHDATNIPLEMLKWEVFNLVTENRLHNVISKIGNHDRKWQQQVFRLFCEDVMEQLGITHAESLADLSPRDREQLSTYLREEVRKLLKAVG
jgi:Rnl2 family RNA ligase